MLEARLFALDRPYRSPETLKNLFLQNSERFFKSRSVFISAVLIKEEVYADE